jgi:hypothetical protein
MKFIVPLIYLEPFMKQMGMKPHAQITEPMPGTNPNLNRYSTSNAIVTAPLDIDIIDTIIEDFDTFLNKYDEAVSRSKVILELRSFAALAAVAPSATAFASRSRCIFVLAEAQFDNSVSNELIRNNIKALKDKVKVIKKQKNPTSVESFNLNIAQGSEKVKDKFGEYYQRLREVRRKYDLNFIVNKWYPIPPAED